MSASTAWSSSWLEVVIAAVQYHKARACCQRLGERPPAVVAKKVCRHVECVHNQTLRDRIAECGGGLRTQAATGHANNSERIGGNVLKQCVP
eukprot:PRCOL_00001458-RA